MPAGARTAPGHRQSRPDRTHAAYVGIVCERLGRYDEALACHEEEAGLYRELADPDAENRAIVRIGWCLHRTGVTARATEVLRAALSTARGSGDDLAACLALTELGRIATAGDDHGEALAAGTEAVDLAGGTDDNWLLSAVPNNLADSLLAAGRADDATRRYGEALLVASQVGDQHEIARAMAGRRAQSSVK